MEKKEENTEMEGESTADEGAAKPTPTERDILTHSERIEELRARLYSRGAEPETRVRHSLRSDTDAPIPRPVESRKPPVKESVRTFIPEAIRARVSTPRSEVPVPQPQRAPLQEITNTPPMSEQKRRRSYRGKLLLLASIFFLGAAGISSFFLFSGSNLISGENISVSVAGPLTVGGGEELALEIAVSNQNMVPIESAMLVIEYPRGTQAVDTAGKELFTERQPLSLIESGEVLKIPVRARVYGEENEEKIVKVSIEYRVAGSNATFFKEAEPLRFKVSSSPVSLSVNTVKSITSGQEAEIELIISSNSPTPLRNLLIKASYPEVGFDFSSSEPDPVGGQDTWLIKEILPGGKKTITLTGVVVGKQDEERAFRFSVGVANEKNAYEMLSTFFTAEQIIALEQPFLDLSMRVNGKSDETVALGGSEDAAIVIDLVNKLDDTLYNASLQVVINGDGVSTLDIDPAQGFYDSSKSTVFWDQSSVDSLDEIPPGAKRTVTIRIDLKSAAGKVPEITLNVTAHAERVFEDRVPQELVGTVSQKIRVEGSAAIAAYAIYSDGPFANEGPVPPVAEQETTYTFLLSVDNGENEVTKAEVSAVLPQYVTWLGNVSEGDTVTYNPASRTMTWSVGDIHVDEHKEAWVQVSMKPSLSQIGTTPTLLGTQRFKANNKFTNTIIRGEAPALTTALENDPNEAVREGKVRAE